MNRLEKTVKKLSSYPSWVLSLAIGNVVKYTGTSKISYDVMTKERVVVSAKNRKKIRNHIGQIHAAAMILLAETATGMVVGMNVPDDKIPLVKFLNTKFVKRSEGNMKAEAWLTPEQMQYIKDTPKGDLMVKVIVTDEAGNSPIECEACWAWISKDKLKKK